MYIPLPTSACTYFAGNLYGDPEKHENEYKLPDWKGGVMAFQCWLNPMKFSIFHRILLLVGGRRIF